MGKMSQGTHRQTQDNEEVILREHTDKYRTMSKLFQRTHKQTQDNEEVVPVNTLTNTRQCINCLTLSVKEQVHSLCVDSRPGDRLRLAKGPHSPHPLFFCQAQSEAHGPPSAMAVRKRTLA